MAIVPGAGGALHATARDGAGQPAQEDGNAHESPCRLYVRRQGQHGVVGLTLHVAGGLVDAIHPYPLPDDLGGEDVAAYEGRDLPLGQRGHRYSHYPSCHGAGKADQLHSSVHHTATL